MLSFSYKPEIGDLISATQAVILRASAAAAKSGSASVPASGHVPAASPGRVSKFLIRLGIKQCCMTGLLFGGIARPPQSGTFVWLVACAWLFTGQWFIRFGMRLRGAAFEPETFVASDEFREVFESSSTVRAVESFKPVTISLDAVRITVKSEDGQHNVLWSGVSRIAHRAGSIWLESHRRTGELIMIPARALPPGTDVDLLTSVLERLRRGDPVPGV
jgi:hypothetical protein